MKLANLAHTLASDRYLGKHSRLLYIKVDDDKIAPICVGSLLRGNRMRVVRYFGAKTAYGNYCLETNCIFCFCLCNCSIHTTCRPISCVPRHGLHDGWASAHDATASRWSRIPSRLRTLPTSRILRTSFVTFFRVPITFKFSSTRIRWVTSWFSECCHRAGCRRVDRRPPESGDKDVFAVDAD